MSLPWKELAAGIMQAGLRRQDASVLRLNSWNLTEFPKNHDGAVSNPLRRLNSMDSGSRFARPE